MSLPRYVLLLYLGAAALLPRAARSEAAAFEPAACNLPGQTPDLAPRLRCGTVRVPRSHDRPDGPSYALSVVVIRADAQPAEPDPVIYISGGPGSPITRYAAYQARHPYAAGRDLVLVDQRGIGRSEPRLCPEHERGLFDATLAAVAADTIEAQDRRRAAYAACRAEAVRRGHDLDDFGTRVTAEDLDAVRQALGLTRWNLYGESYGTAVAMTLMALHPETIRSVVLDSLYPPDPMPLFSENVRDARDALFALCAAEVACAAAYPDLAGLYAGTLDRLAHAPLPIAAPAPGGHGPTLLTASLFDAIIAQFLYMSAAYPVLPGLIRAVHDGQAAPLAAMAGPLFPALLTQNRAAHAAVECRDRPHWRLTPPEAANGLDRAQLYGICADWSDLGPPIPVPAGTAVPVLVLAGRFDPVARPALSRQVAESIGPAARWIEFPGMGHNIHGSSPCGVRIAAAFIAAPEQPPDTGCVAGEAPIRFALPGH